MASAGLGLHVAWPEANCLGPSFPLISGSDRYVGTWIGAVNLSRVRLGQHRTPTRLFFVDILLFDSGSGLV